MRSASRFLRRSSRIVSSLVALVALERAMAADITSGVGVRLGAGYDSNPLLVTQDGPSAAFAQVDFDARIDVKPTPAVDVFLRSEGWARSHASNVQDADTWGGEVRTGLSLPRLGTQRRPLSLALGARASTRHDTFVDRATGQVYRLVLPTTPASSAPIPDRFDSESMGAFLNARFRTSPRVLLSFDGRLDVVDYARDHDAIASLGSLDCRATSLEPGVYVKLSDPVSMGFSIVFAGIGYDEQPALDANGAGVPGTLREYDSREYRFVIAVTPSGPWGARFGHRIADRMDSYSGYSDYSATTTYLTLDRKIGTGNRVEIQAVRSDLGYAHAVVPGSADGALRGSELVGLTARFDKALGTSSLRWYSEVGVQRGGSHDPVYAYDRDWALTGIEFRR